MCQSDWFSIAKQLTNHLLDNIKPGQPLVDEVVSCETHHHQTIQPKSVPKFFVPWKQLTEMCNS